jgi:hypothetical protein
VPCLPTSQLHRNFNTRAERVDHRDEALDADAPEMRVSNARKISGIDPG